jgi:hypothetical protein
MVGVAPSTKPDEFSGYDVSTGGPSHRSLCGPRGNFPPTQLPMQMRLPAFPRSALISAVVVLAACSEQSVTAVVAPETGRVAAVVEDPTGPSCTLTQGYWKQHPEVWDDAGDGMPFLTTDPFYNSGVDNLTIMRMPPKGGNAYEILAHQYIAALLNLNGAAAGVAEVDEALAGATDYFTNEVAGIPNPEEPTRSQLIAWAATLDDYNRGVIGPGHCG